MPFTSYNSVDDVAHAHRIRCRRETFVVPAPGPLGDNFRSELAFTLKEVAYNRTEAAACETLIYPLLREVWKSYREALTLWSHEFIKHDDDLCGVPDYIVARRSPLGSIIFDLPYVLVVEAKRDDFVRGWGQCLAAMLTSQKINDTPDQTFYGITTNGRMWEFGQLQGGVFSLDARSFALDDLDDLAAALHFVMIQCRDQVTRQPTPA